MRASRWQTLVRAGHDLEVGKMMFFKKNWMASLLTLLLSLPGDTSATSLEGGRGRCSITFSAGLGVLVNDKLKQEWKKFCHKANPCHVLICRCFLNGKRAETKAVASKDSCSSILKLPGYWPQWSSSYRKGACNTRHYGLTICVPPKMHMWKPQFPEGWYLKKEPLEGNGLDEAIRVSDLIRRGRHQSFLHHVRTQGEGGCMQPGRGSSREPDHARPPIANCQSPDVWEINVWCSSHLVGAVCSSNLSWLTPGVPIPWPGTLETWLAALVYYCPSCYKP